MLDVWIAEPQLLGSSLHLWAWRARRAHGAWRLLSAFGALTIIGFTLPILPLLFLRTPLVFRVPALV
jgi:hypothetical protein